MKMKKYQLFQPASLRAAAAARAAGWALAHCEELMWRTSRLHPRYPAKADRLLDGTIDAIRNHIRDKTPKLFHNELAAALIQAIVHLLNINEQTSDWNHNENTKHVVNVISRMIETVFTEHLTSLVLDDKVSFVNNVKTGHSTWQILKPSLCSKAALLAGLEHLDIRSRAPAHDVVMLLTELRSLKYLYLQTCTRDILKCLSDNCKLLEEVHVLEENEHAYHRNITDDDIDILSELHNLRHVDLSGARVTATKQAIANLLLRCEDLESINITSNRTSIESALQYIASHENLAERQFNLKCFRDRSETTTEQLQLVVRMCPKIQKIELVNNVSQNYLLPLRDLPDLRELIFRGFDFDTDGVKELLEARGRRLQRLELRSVRGVGARALAGVCQTCPALEILNLTCNFVKDDFPHILNPNPKKISPLKHVKKLSFESLESKPSGQHLIFLLSNCPNVEFVEIRGLGTLLNDIMFEVLVGSKNLIHMMELEIYGTELSKSVVELIGRNCVNRPTVATVTVQRRVGYHPFLPYTRTVPYRMF